MYTHSLTTGSTSSPAAVRFSKIPSAFRCVQKEPVIAKPREQVGEYAPKIISMQIDPQKIGDVVGQRGKTINAIIEQTGVKIDITDDGSVSICGTDAAMMDRAAELIRIIVTDFEAGQVFTGKVVSIKEFGAFV